MVVIRLARSGAKKNPFYNIVAADRRMPRDGRYIEKLGYYNPVARGMATRLSCDLTLIQAWVAKGAQPSPRVKTLLKEYSQGKTGAQLEKTGASAAREAAANKAKADAEAKAESTQKAKPEAKAEAKAETKPAAKAETKAEAKAETKPAAKAEAKAETKPATKADTKPKD